MTGEQAVQLITVVLGLGAAGYSTLQVSEARRARQAAQQQAEEATRQREIAERMREITEGQLNAAREANRTADELRVITERQLNEAREANRIAAEALALQRAEAEARDQYHLRVIPQNDDVILINGGRFDVKILEMRLLGPGAIHFIQISDDQWLSPQTYDAEFFIRAGSEGRVLNATPDRYVLMDERFTLRMRVWLDNAHRILEFTGIRQWDQLRLGDLAVTTDLNQAP